MQAVVDSARRRFAGLQSQKEPFSVALWARCLEASPPSFSLKNARLHAIIAICFAGLLRIGEALALNVSDVRVGESLEVVVKKSKTEQHGKGVTVTIDPSDTSVCPVLLFRTFWEAAELDAGHQAPSCPVFRSLRFDLAKGRSVCREQRLKYPAFLAEFKSVLADIGLEASAYGTHSLRAGGATAAARAGVPALTLKKAGRWRADESRDVYVRHSFALSKFIF